MASATLLHEYHCGGKSESASFAMLWRVHPDGAKNNISARMYEYFVTQYSQRVACVQNAVDLGRDYNAKCEEFSKKNFACFRRGNERLFIAPPDITRQSSPAYTPLCVTLSTLRFYHWVALREVDLFIHEHFSKIQSFRKKQDEGACDDLALQMQRLEIKPKRGRPKRRDEKEKSTAPLAVKSSSSTDMRSRTKKEKMEVIEVPTNRWHLPPRGTKTFIKKLH